MSENDISFFPTNVNEFNSECKGPALLSVNYVDVRRHPSTSVVGPANIPTLGEDMSTLKGPLAEEVKSMMEVPEEPRKEYSDETEVPCTTHNNEGELTIHLTPKDPENKSKTVNNYPMLK